MHDVNSISSSAKHTKRNKELATIGARPRIRHAQRALVRMLQRRHDLILELAAVDRLAASAGAGWVTALYHKAWDDAVEDDAVVLAGGGELGEVLACLEDVLGCHGLGVGGGLLDLWRLVSVESDGDVADVGVKDYAFTCLATGRGWCG